MAAKRILIIDDEQELLDLLKITFEQEQFKVFTANDGEAGLKLAVSKKPSAIILDINMPRLNGYEFLSRLKKDERLASIPVLVFTSLTETVERSDEEWARSMEVEDFAEVDVGAGARSHRDICSGEMMNGHRPRRLVPDQHHAFGGSAVFLGDAERVDDRCAIQSLVEHEPRSPAPGDSSELGGRAGSCRRRRDDEVRHQSEVAEGHTHALGRADTTRSQGPIVIGGAVGVPVGLPVAEEHEVHGWNPNAGEPIVPRCLPFTGQAALMAKRIWAV